MRTLVLVLLVATAAVSAGCTDKLAFSSDGGTLDAPAFSVTPEKGDATTVFKVSAGKLGDNHNITWNFGDGVVKYGKFAEHAFGFTNGVMSITLIATDDTGKQGFATRTITLGTGKNAEPTVTMRATRSWVEARVPANFTATGRDGDNDPLSYLWTYSILQGGAAPADGHAHEHGSGATPTAGQEFVIDGNTAKASVIFEAAGKYVVKVRATDPKGAESVAEKQIDVSRMIPNPNVVTQWTGNLRVGTGAAAVANQTLAEQAWDQGAPDSNVDAARHTYSLLYPAMTTIYLQWNDTSTQGAFDLDLELRNAKTNEVVFSSTNRAPAAAIEYNVTAQTPGDYVIIVRAVTGAQIDYTLTLFAQLKLTPELVAAAEGS